MSDDGERAWFAPKAFGFGWRPATWQGWVVTLALVVAIPMTSLLGDPEVVRPRSQAAFVKVKAMLGLSGTHLSRLAIVVLIVLEVAAFLAFARWKSLRLKPLD